MLNTLLDGRSNTWLQKELVKYGIDLSSPGLSQVLSNKNECRLSYALAICQIFKCSVEKLFFLEY
jgi:DNA-binding XRE family transcriptional regulator